MEEKKKKKRWKIALLVGLPVVGVIGGIVAYKKCPKFKGLIDAGVSKVCKKETQTPVQTTPQVNTKPFGGGRRYEKYNKN